MKFVLIGLLACLFQQAAAQELFVYTEPASNMAAKSIGVRVTNNFMKEPHRNKYNYHLLPELMLGVSKKIMVHAEGFFSDRMGGLKAEGAGAYLKYRFYSVDEVHSHTRVAAFARGSYNNSDIHQPAIDLNGHNSGVEAGLVATKLIQKLALSSSASFLHASDNGDDNKFPHTEAGREAISYTFSAGRLILPFHYVDYKQTNLNLMAEFLGQVNLATGKNYLDLAPSVQLIFLSRMRLDLGYRFPLLETLDRTTNRGFLVRVEFNFFNAYK